MYDLDLSDLGDWIVAHVRAENESLDMQYQLFAWQTALLMNSTGNYKKSIKPDDLYTPLADVKNRTEVEEYTFEDRQKLQEELLQSFNDSNVVIQ